MAVASGSKPEFANEDFRFKLGTVQGDAKDFFLWSDRATIELAERKHWLSTDPQRYARLAPGGEPIANEWIESIRSWPQFRLSSSDFWSNSIDSLQRMKWISGCLEPDFVLLASNPSMSAESTDASQLHSDDRDKVFRVIGGCVCFPSSWSLPDKMLQPVQAVHQPVPQLNAALGVQIDRLISHLRPGKCLIRSNWSVCSVPELNQHPDRQIPPVSSPVKLDDAWLRCEEQCLFSLPQSGGVVFGIRVTHRSWASLRQSPEAARNIARSLRTMPHDLRCYKRLNLVADELAQLLVGENSAESPN